MESDHRVAYAICIAAVLIAAIVAAIVYFNIEGAIEKRRDCAEAGGSWISSNQCLVLGGSQ